MLPQLESQKAQIEQRLSSGELQHDELMQLSAQMSEIMELIEQKEMRWLELSEI